MSIYLLSTTKKKLRVMFFSSTTTPASSSLLRRSLIARSTSVPVRSSALNHSIAIANPAPALPLAPPQPSPSPPLANHVLTLAQRTPLATILAASDSDLPTSAESPALRCCTVDTSCPRTGERNSGRGGYPRRPPTREAVGGRAPRSAPTSSYPLLHALPSSPRNPLLAQDVLPPLAPLRRPPANSGLPPGLLAKKPLCRRLFSGQEYVHSRHRPPQVRYKIDSPHRPRSLPPNPEPYRAPNRREYSQQ